MVSLNSKNFVLTPWCDTMECEENVKKRSAQESKEEAVDEQMSLTGAAKTLCIPL